MYLKVANNFFLLVQEILMPWVSHGLELEKTDFFLIGKQD
jgi:hypothetical protein